MAHALAPDGVRIHYEIHSAGQDRSLAPVVLVQGLGLSSRFWFELPAVEPAGGDGATGRTAKEGA